MTPKDFKIKYPQYSHLEGDELWNKMEDTLLQSKNVLYADPNQEKVWLNPVKVNILQDSGEYKEFNVVLEDESQTRWLNSEGELVKIGDNFPSSSNGSPTESYSFAIIDFSENN